jgi:uncharacterized protein YyaL (SSP411 family)
MAKSNARFIIKNLFNQEENKLKRCFNKNQKKENLIDGFLDDYSFFIKSLIDIYESTNEIEWLKFGKFFYIYKIKFLIFSFKSN